MTDRQKIVQHFVDNNIVAQQPVDMAIYLAGDLLKRRPDLEESKDYAEKVLKAGYKSRMAVDLHTDILEAQKRPKTQTEKEKTE